MTERKIDPSELRVGDRVRKAVEGTVTWAPWAPPEVVHIDGVAHSFGQGEWFLLDRPEPPLRDGVYQIPGEYRRGCIAIRRDGKWMSLREGLPLPMKIYSDDSARTDGYQFVGPEAGSEQNGESNG